MEKTNLIINYIPPQMNENDMTALFSSVGEIVSLKLIRDKNGVFPINPLNTQNLIGGQSLGYGFIKFRTEEQAVKAIQAFNGLKLKEKVLKVAFARQTETENKSMATNIYVSGLPKTIQDQDFEAMFRKFGEITTYKIFRQENNDKLNAIGFVLFNERSDAEKAIKELDGKVPDGYPSPIHVKFSQPPGQKQQAAPKIVMPIVPGAPINHQMSPQVLMPNTQLKIPGNWTLFVYNLAPETEELDLWKLFGPFGAISNIKIIKDNTTNVSKGYAFVTMTHYEEALLAIRGLNGFALANRILQVSFKTNNTANENRKRRLTQ